MTGSSRPNLSKNIGANEKLKAPHVQERIHLTSKPYTSMDSPKQTYAEVVNGGSSFFRSVERDEISDSKSCDHATADYAMCVSSDVVHNSKSGQTKLGLSSRSTHACKICPPPNSMVVSKDNSCTTTNACPTYEFMLLNVACLLLNMSRDKSKIKFIGDLCSNQTLFVVLCETFLSDVISDFEISISNYNIIRYSRIGGGVCIYLKQSICYDLLLSYSNSVCDLLIIRLIQPELIVILIYGPPSCSGGCYSENEICYVQTGITTTKHNYVGGLQSPNYVVVSTR